MVEYSRFEVKNETEDQNQSIPKSMGTLTVLRCILVQIWKAWLQSVLTYRADKLTSSKWGKFWLLSSIWPWRSRSMNPQNNWDLHHCALHTWSKFGDSSLNGWQVIVRTNLWLPDTQLHTQTQATTIPEGQNWPWVKKQHKFFFAKRNYNIPVNSIRAWSIYAKHQWPRTNRKWGNVSSCFMFAIKYGFIYPQCIKDIYGYE